MFNFKDIIVNATEYIIKVVLFFIALLTFYQRQKNAKKKNDIEKEHEINNRIEIACLKSMKYTDTILTQVNNSFSNEINLLKQENKFQNEKLEIINNNVNYLCCQNAENFKDINKTLFEIIEKLPNKN